MYRTKWFVFWASFYSARQYLYLIGSGDRFCGVWNFLSVQSSATLYRQTKILLLFQIIIILAGFIHFMRS